MNRIYAVVIISFFAFLISMIIKSYTIKCEIDDFGKTIIGKYVSHKSYPKTQNNYFIYYINGQIFKNFSSENISSEFRKNIGKFYKIKYLDKYPEAIHPLYEQEVTDTAEILNAGFSMDDILNKKENNLFPWYKHDDEHERDAITNNRDMLKSLLALFYF